MVGAQSIRELLSRGELASFRGLEEIFKTINNEKLSRAAGL